MRPLAIIEQDSAASETLRRSIEAAGFRADCFTDGLSALTSIRRRPFSLAILDLDLGGDDPFAIIREMSRLVPVITMTAEGNEDVRVRAFEAGADDCVMRTLNARELVARVRNILRRAPKSDTTCELEELSISLPEMRIRTGGAVHELSRGEAEVLALLLEHAPAPLTPTDMARLLPAKRATIESRIKSLRKKIGPGRLVSRGRFGYELR